jgi:hypothetical protein
MPRFQFTVDRSQVDGFLRVYNRGGLHLLFDETSRNAMRDFANIAIESARENAQFRLAIFKEVLAEVKAAKQESQSAAPPTKMQGDITTKPLVTLT